MLYFTLGAFLLAGFLMFFDFMGVTPGAAGLSNALLLVGLVFLGIRGLSFLRHRHHLHQPSHR